MKYTEGYYNEKMEKVSKGVSDAIFLEFACNDKNQFVGNRKMGEFLESKGINPELIDGMNCCIIGFNKTEQMWYGWSYRAICGFGIGSIVKQGDCAFKPSNRDEFIADLECWYSDCENVKIEPVEHEVKVSYDIPEYNPKPVDQNLLDSIKQAFPEGLVSVAKSHEARHIEFIEKYPETWGRGEWIAETLEDAKQMAIDFARSVS